MRFGVATAAIRRAAVAIPFFDGNDVRLLSARFGLATALSFVGADRHALQVSLELVAFSWGWGVGVCGGTEDVKVGRPD